MTATISYGCIRQLYLQKYQFRKDPIFQILGFQVSEMNQKEIIVRVSDKESFLDCLLVGPYNIVDDKILSDKFSLASQTFSKFDIIKIVDYFCKIDTSKICHLKIIIRRITQCSSSKEIIGKPQQIANLIDSEHRQDATLTNNAYQPFTSLASCSMGKQDAPIKIQQGIQNVRNNIPQMPPSQKRKSQLHQIPCISSSRKQQDPLSLYDILNNKPGYFIGRLVRIKFGLKEAKDGPMHFLYLGFLDINGELVRIYIAGRLAVKESKELRKHKCYFIKGLQLFHGDKTKTTPQIRLKQRQYRIHQIVNQVITSRIKHQYYHWQHQYETIQFQNVDVIGIIQDIEQKISYRQNTVNQEQRDVVRVIVRNVHKTVKISFWADQIKQLEQLNLHRRQSIIIQDIKKKKSIFLDFTSESNLIILDNKESLKTQFEHLLPSSQQANQPTNIMQLYRVFDLEPNNSKVRILNLYIGNIVQNRVVYKMCVNCKKKVQRVLETCFQCQKDQFVFKYNCQIDFSDSSGSVSCVAFDPICEKIFHKSAYDISQMNQIQIKVLCDQLIFEQYRVSLQSKNNRILVRSLEQITQKSIMSQLHQSLTLINLIKSSQASYFSL